MKQTTKSLLFFSAAHFLVDFSCAFIVFSKTPDSSLFYIGLFFYNFCAFALQMPLGLLIDRSANVSTVVSMGFLLLLPPLLLPLNPLLLVLMAGLGNALFHVGGGTCILRQNPGRCSEPGIFVSTGALGLFAGTLLGKSSGFPIWLLSVLLLVFALFSSFFGKTTSQTGSQTAGLELHSSKKPQHLSPALCFSLICLLAVVILRSYLGMILSFDWKSQPSYGLLLIVSIMAGKALGGILADRFGLWKTGIASLAAAALLLLFSGHPTAGIPALLVFNMTMPLTLSALVRLLPTQPGFCFGLLTFALFLGFLPVYLGLAPKQSIFWLYSLLAILSLLLMALAGIIIYCERRKSPCRSSPPS